MELRHLRYFVAVAEAMSFRKAAEKLEIAQPPLSRQIRDLELEMGVRLLERNQRNVLLTKAGKAFLQDARILLHQLDTAVNTARKIHHNSESTLTIGFVRSASYQLLPQLLQALGTPQPPLQLIEMPPSDLLPALQQQHIDCAIGYLPTSRADSAIMSGLQWFSYQQEVLYLVSPPSPEPKDSSVGGASLLENRPFILPPQLWDREDGARSAFIAALPEQPTQIIEVTDREVALSFVINQLGKTILPKSMLASYPDPLIQREEWKDHQNDLELALIWRSKGSSKNLSLILVAMEALLQSLSKEVNASQG